MWRRLPSLESSRRSFVCEQSDSLASGGRHEQLDAWVRAALRSDPGRNATSGDRPDSRVDAPLATVAIRPLRTLVTDSVVAGRPTGKPCGPGRIARRCNANWPLSGRLWLNGRSRRMIDT